MSKNPAWLQPLRPALKVVEVKTLFPYLDRGEGAPEVAVHQQLLFEVLHSLREGEGPTTELVIHTEQEWISLRNGG
jgi:hypothetical protein